MSDLASLQRAFAATLTARSIDDVDVSAFVGAPHNVRHRLGYYRGNVQASARKALANAYPVCAKLVGDEFFDGLAFEYAARAPSGSGDMNEYGVGLAAFLDAFPAAGQVPYLSDVARLEWLVHRAHYAGDGSALAWDRLAAIPEARFGDLAIRLHPACALLESRWPVTRIWHVHRPDWRGDFAVDLDAGPDFALVHRPAFRVEVTALERASFVFLDRAAGGARLGDAFAAATSVDADYALDRVLAEWVRSRVIVGVGLPES